MSAYYRCIKDFAGWKKGTILDFSKLTKDQLSILLISFKKHFRKVTAKRSFTEPKPEA